MKTRRFKKDIPPEKGEETGIAMDNMKPSGSCPEKNEVVVVVVVAKSKTIGFDEESLPGRFVS